MVSDSLGGQFSEVPHSCPNLCDPMECSTPGFPVHHQLLELAQTHVRPVGDAIQPSHPLLTPSPPAFNLSQHQGLFKWVSSYQVAKVLEFQLQHQSFQWVFRNDFLWIDWFDLLAMQGTLKSSPAPQFKRINALVLSFVYSQTLTSIHDHWKNHSFDWQTFVSKVMSLLFNMLSRLVTAFLPRSKHLLISWLQSPSAAILEHKK